MEIKWIAAHKCVDNFRDDHDAYWYFKQVFDGANAFDLVKCEEIAGGTDNNGVTVRTYRSAKGNEITLRIDGGFPIPELAIFDLTGGTVNETFIEELVAAFEQFHNSRFQYFLTKRDDGRSYRLDLYPNSDKPLIEKKPTPPVETPPKWQVVYDAAASLHIFKEVNERYLQGDGYQKLIEILSDKYHSLDIADQTNPQWKESSRGLSITGSYEHWVGHDDTLSESIEMKFIRLHPWEWEEPSEWTAESEWPCAGEYQYTDESKNEGDNWSYSIMSHKAWMFKNPFGLPGVWSFEYLLKRER